MFKKVNIVYNSFNIKMMDKKEIRKLYNNQSHLFVKEQESYIENKHIISIINSFLEDIGGKKILFAGCGNGKECEYSINNNADVYGIDLSNELIEIAKKKFPNNKEKFLVQDMERTSLKDSFFDIIIANFSLMYSNNLKAVFGEFGRLLKFKGLFIFSVPHPVRKMKKYNCENYFVKGKRYESWKSIKRFNYYRLFEDYINSISNSNFILKKVVEPKPKQNSRHSNYPHHILFKLVKGGEK